MDGWLHEYIWWVEWVDEWIESVTEWIEGKYNAEHLLLESLYVSMAISFSLVKLGMKQSQLSSQLTLLYLQPA